jgi:segregation and condensation protein A
MSTAVVHDLDLDLEAFEGPFDLLLTLVLKDELELADVEIAGVVFAFLERLAEREAADLEACGEFLVLVAALLELKARALFPDDDELPFDELDPEEAAGELAERLALYRRFKAAAEWLEERLAAEGDRYFRLGPAPLAPVPARPLARISVELDGRGPEMLATAIRRLAAPPPEPSLRHLALRFPPVSLFLERFRAVLRRRRQFEFDVEVGSLSRVEQAVAFLALLELRKAGEVRLGQGAPFEPITVWSAA